MHEYNSLTRCLFFDIQYKKLFVIIEKNKEGKQTARLPKASDFDKGFLGLRSRFNKHIFLSIPNHFDIMQIFRKVPEDWDYLKIHGKDCQFKASKKTKLVTWNLLQPKDRGIVEEFCAHLQN